MPPELHPAGSWPGDRGRTFWALLLLALVARLVFLLVIAHPELRQGSFTFPDGSDEADYHQLASQLADSGVYALSPDGPPTAKRTPGLPLVMAGLYVFFGPRPVLAVAWVMACSLGIVAVIGALARRLAGNDLTAYLAMLGAALLPTLIFTSAGIWSEPPALLFFLLALWWIQRSEAGNDRALAAAALAFAVSYLHRPSIGPVIALVGLRVLLIAWRSRRLRGVFIFGLVTALPILCWGLRNQLVFGQPMVGNTESTAALWGANNPLTAGLETPAIASVGGFDLLREAESGAYRGSWVPLSYLRTQAPAGLPEIERQQWYGQQVSRFVRQNPEAFARLLLHKVQRIVTAEPMAPSILGESPGQRRLKWLVTLSERWILLIFGGWGLLSMARGRHPLLPSYALFLAGSLAVVIVAYVNARIFLPVSATLLVPAALASSRLRVFVERFPGHDEP